MIYYSIHPDVLAFSTECTDKIPEAVVLPTQTHSSNIAIVEQYVSQEQLQEVDALITKTPGLPIGVRTADCIPVLIYDPVAGVVAAIHAGWKGTVAKITERTVSLMRQKYNSQPSNTIAFIAPGICLDCFQVGKEVVERFEHAGFPMERIYEFRPSHEPFPLDKGHHINLWEANKFLLEKSGVPTENITICGQCTFTSNNLFSARRDGIRTGRIVTSICIK